MLSDFNLPVTYSKGVYTLNLFGLITSELASQAVSDLMQIEDVWRSEPHTAVKIILCSSGGDLDSGLAIVDTILAMETKIITIGTGEVCSTALPILASGDPNHRYATPSCMGMHHHGITVPAGAYDAHLEQEYVAYTKLRETAFSELMSKLTTKSAEWWWDTAQKNQDLWLTPPQMIALGVIDGILSPYKNQLKKGRDISRSNL